MADFARTLSSLIYFIAFIAAAFISGYVYLYTLMSRGIMELLNMPTASANLYLLYMISSQNQASDGSLAMAIVLIILGLLLEPIVQYRKRMRNSPDVVPFDTKRGKYLCFKSEKGFAIMLADSFLFFVMWTFGCVLLFSAVADFTTGYFSTVFCLLLIIQSGISYALRSRSVMLNAIIFAGGVMLLAALGIFSLAYNNVPVLLNIVISIVTLFVVGMSIMSHMKE